MIYSALGVVIGLLLLLVLRQRAELRRLRLRCSQLQNLLARVLGIMKYLTEKE